MPSREGKGEVERDGKEKGEKWKKNGRKGKRGEGREREGKDREERRIWEGKRKGWKKGKGWRKCKAKVENGRNQSISTDAKISLMQSATSM